MTATVEVEIESGLNDHLSALASIWPVSWPNVEFTPPNNGQYLIVNHFPNDPTPGIGDDTQNFRGLYQITVVTPRNKGAILGKTEAARIARHFPHAADVFSTASGPIRVSREPRVSTGIPTENTYEIPVTVVYELTGVKTQ